MSLGKVLKRGDLWSFALYAQEGPFRPEESLEKPLRVFNSKRLRFSPRWPYTQADPFLWVNNDELFIFYEKVIPRGVGKIACLKTANLVDFEDLGVVLDLPHHLSYPFVFADGNRIYMVPESRRAGEVALYEFGNFPGSLIKVRTLVSGDYADSFVIEQDGLWYLFASSAEGLMIFVSDDLLGGAFAPHPANPVCTDARYSRSGGGPLRIGGKLVRVAQDCSKAYGSNASLIEVTKITPDDYAERLIVPNYFQLNETWNRNGAHHLSVARFREKAVIAVDGRHKDYLINRILPRLATLGRR